VELLPGTGCQKIKKTFHFRDPLWIGAWWAGFLTIGVVLFGPSLGLFCFRAPPPAEQEEEEKDPETKEPFLDTETKKKPTKRYVPITYSKYKDLYFRRSPGLALVDRHVQKNAAGQSIVPPTVKEKAMDFYKTIRTVIKQPIYFCKL
jgi:hypothetical protein